MGRFLVATIKSWNIDNFCKLRDEYSDHEFKMINRDEELNIMLLKSFAPDMIFFPHWSWIIPKEIFSSYECIVFHMTDLPYGRGGSPLQNLLERGIYDTKISAIKVTDGIDTGPIYIKEPINIREGNANEIFKRVSDIIFDKMIPQFLQGKLEPHNQIGEIEVFKRRTPEQSEIPDGLTMRQLYDYIRMLDGEGYPPAYRKYGTGKIIFTDATIVNEMVNARVKFVGD